MFKNTYPYTDFHELNLDWLLERLTKVESRIDGIKEEVEKDMKEYVDAQMSPYVTKLNQLIAQVNALDNKVTETLEDYAAEIVAFEKQVDDKIDQIQKNIANQIEAVNLLTDTKIEQNNVYIIDQVQKSLGNVVMVINPFDGSKVTIQQMVDILAAYHITDALTYLVMADRALTYEQFNNLNLTYTQLLLHGNTDYK